MANRLDTHSGARSSAAKVLTNSFASIEQRHRELRNSGTVRFFSMRNNMEFNPSTATVVCNFNSTILIFPTDMENLKVASYLFISRQ